MVLTEQSLTSVLGSRGGLLGAGVVSAGVAAVGSVPGQAEHLGSELESPPIPSSKYLEMDEDLIMDPRTYYGSQTAAHTATCLPGRVPGPTAPAASMTAFRAPSSGCE